MGTSYTSFWEASDMCFFSINPARRGGNAFPPRPMRLHHRCPLSDDGITRFFPSKATINLKFLAISAEILLRLQAVETHSFQNSVLVAAEEDRRRSQCNCRVQPQRINVDPEMGRTFPPRLMRLHHRCPLSDDGITRFFPSVQNPKPQFT